MSPSTFFFLSLFAAAVFALRPHTGRREGPKELHESGHPKIGLRSQRNCDDCFDRTAWGGGIPFHVSPPFFLDLWQYLQPPHLRRGEAPHHNFYRIYPVPSPSHHGGRRPPSLYSERPPVVPWSPAVHHRPSTSSVPSAGTTSATTLRPKEYRDKTTPARLASTAGPSVHATSSGQYSHHSSTVTAQTELADTTTFGYESTAETDYPTSTTEESVTYSTILPDDYSTGLATDRPETRDHTHYFPTSTEGAATEYSATENEGSSTPEEAPVVVKPSSESYPSSVWSFLGGQKITIGVMPSEPATATLRSSSNADGRRASPNPKERYGKKLTFAWPSTQRIKFFNAEPAISNGLNPGKKYSIVKSKPTVTPYTTTDAPTTSDRPTTFFTTTKTSYKGGPSVIDKLVVYMNNRLVDAVEARASPRKKRSYDSTPGSVMTEYMSEALEELDEETLLDILSTLEDEYLSRASPEEVEVIEDTFDRLRISVMRAKAETGSRFRADDEWRIKRATKKQRTEGTAAILELLTSEDEYQERVDMGMYDDEEMSYDDYYYYEDEAAVESDQEPSLLELVSLANKQQSGNTDR